jgi:hypothetical protein
MKIEFSNEELDKLAEKVAELVMSKLCYDGINADTLVREVPNMSNILRKRLVDVMKYKGCIKPTLSDVARYNKSSYLNLRGMGNKSVAELSLILKNAGLSFGKEMLFH